MASKEFRDAVKSIEMTLAFVEASSVRTFALCLRPSVKLTRVPVELAYVAAHQDTRKRA